MLPNHNEKISARDKKKAKVVLHKIVSLGTTVALLTLHTDGRMMPIFDTLCFKIEAMLSKNVFPGYQGCTFYMGKFSSRVPISLGNHADHLLMSTY